jgi:hypothetical protein
MAPAAKQFAVIKDMPWHRRWMYGMIFTAIIMLWIAAGWKAVAAVLLLFWAHKLDQHWDEDLSE